MAATVAAHKTIVQDISLASPFRISAPLYWHARFSFLSFLLFRFLFRLHGVLRAARTRETERERERERFGTMIMRLDAPPMHFDYILAGRNVYPATFRSYSYPFLLIAFLFFPTATLVNRDGDSLYARRSEMYAHEIQIWGEWISIWTLHADLFDDEKFSLFLSMPKVFNCCLPWLMDGRSLLIHSFDSFWREKRRQ